MFSGYFVAVNGIKVPEKFMECGTYKATPNRRLDEDSSRNGNGVLDRNTLEHKPSTIEWQTPSYMTMSQKTELMQLLTENYVDENERSIMVTFYDDEYDTYKEELMYLDPNTSFPVYGQIGSDYYYQSIKITLTGY